MPDALAPPYARCPKCGHAPLPDDQALPAECAACGLILAKYGAPLPRPPHSPETASAREWLASWLFLIPDRVGKIDLIARAAMLGVFSLWTLWIWSDLDIRGGVAGSTFLHAILLPFHEAGHYLIFRWFGQFIMTLGGTLGQHLMPIVLGGALLIQKRDGFGAAIFFWLLGFSTIDMAVYMYDAFDPKLILLGGATGAESDAHDWQNIFGDLGLLGRARSIGLISGALGMAMMLAGLAWAARVLWLQKARVSDSL